MPRLRFPSLALAVGLAVLLTQQFSATIPDPEDQTADQRAVLAADAQQRLAVASVDLAAIGRNSGPSSESERSEQSNSYPRRFDPDGCVQDNEVFERNCRRGGHYGQRSGGNGSRSRLSQGYASEQARMYGRKTLNRRYTNIYIRSGEGWLHLARHANVVRDEPAP